ncbi:MAG: LysR substrate-binding domain-containing protein, partial [Beijerinckiaceae bacterium]|nr:LysR substrate-binding domain-containing protein [Beijerinckiaceae bacterium]
ANGFSPNIAYEAPQIVSTLNLVAAGMGVSVVPESMQRLRLDDVVYRPMAGPGQPSGHLNLAIRADGGSAAEAFVQIVSQAGRKKAKSPASVAASRR